MAQVEVPSDQPARSDEALLHAIAERDRSALRELHDRHAGWIEVRLERRCPDRHITEEVVQDLFMVVWRRPEAFRGDGDVAAWLWGIAIRRLMQRLRPRKNLVERLTALRPVGSESPEELVLAQVAHGDLAGALNGLAPELRAVVQATVLDGLSTREAARLLGIPQGTVKTRMSRARVQMREALT